MTTYGRDAAIAAAVLALADPSGTGPAVAAVGLAVSATELLPVAATAVLLTRADGGADVAATSTEEPLLHQVLAVSSESGPGADCLRGGRAVTVVDLTREQHRWLRFAAKAAAAGVRAAHALPLRRRDDVPGALLLLCRAPGPLPVEHHRLAQTLADAAAFGLLHVRERRHGEMVTEQLRGALRSRVVIEQAKGALAQHSGLDPDQAFLALRERARRLRQPLTQLAGDVVSRRVAPSTIISTDIAAEDVRTTTGDRGAGHMPPPSEPRTM